MKILDRFPCVNTHKFGVLYVRRGQEKNELEILSNEFGSSRYTDFLSGLGELISLTDCNPTDIFLGGLDRSGADGKFTYVWRDETTHGNFIFPFVSSDSDCNIGLLYIVFPPPPQAPFLLGGEG